MKRILSWISHSLVRQISAGLVVITVIIATVMTMTFFQVRAQRSNSLVISLAAEQRQLAERIGALSLLAAQGDWQAAKDLNVSTSRFEQILSGLRHGDESLGLPPASPEFDELLSEVQLSWDPKRSDIDKILENTKTAVVINQMVFGMNQRSTALANLSTELYEMYSESEDIPADVLEKSHKQAELSLAIAQNALSVINDQTEATSQMVAAADEYDQNLTMFIEGDAALGLPAAEGPILDQLLSIQRVWTSWYGEINSLAEVAGTYSDVQNSARSLSDNSVIITAHSQKAVDYFTNESLKKMDTLQVLLAIGGLILIVFSVFISLSIRKSLKPLSDIEEVATSISHEDLLYLKDTLQAFADQDLTKQVHLNPRNVLLNRKDEIGRLATAFQSMVDHLYEAGQSVESMRVKLNSVLLSIQHDAQDVSNTSIKMNDAALSSTEISGQIAKTMMEVAQGVGKQTEQVTQTTTSLDQMMNSIKGLAMGAQDQSLAIANVTNETHKLYDVIQQVIESVGDSAQRANSTTQAAQSGSEKVEAHIDGMKKVRDQVTASMEKVELMGEKSVQINQMLETIEDIAAQTNLLALNAAIEAARAGEHGKGFSVVADEVRKLADRSAEATREIGDLLSEVMKAVQDAVSSMTESVNGVETGTEQALQTGEALKTILDEAILVRKQTEVISEGANQMRQIAEIVVNETTSVSAVIEENTAATEEMSATSTEISEAMENVASISEENSAAAEEVSASAIEVKNQAMEVSDASTVLAEKAKDVEKLVLQFKLEDEKAVDIGLEN